MTARVLLRLLQRHGWTIGRIRGSHHLMVRTGRRSVPLPLHGKRDLPGGLVKAILKQTGIEEE